MKVDTTKIVVDPLFEPLIRSVRWHTNTHGNLACSMGANDRIVYLSQLILGKRPSGLDIDHIDRDVYNNKAKNLRIVTRKANLLNHGDRHINLSGSTFQVCVGSGNYIGRRKTYDEAAELYDKNHLEIFRKELSETRHLNEHLLDEEFYFYLCPTF